MSKAKVINRWHVIHGDVLLQALKHAARYKNPITVYNKLLETGETQLFVTPDTVSSNYTSRLPGWHPHHECGIFCDGQDGASSKCSQEKKAGPPLGKCGYRGALGSFRCDLPKHKGKLHSSNGDVFREGPLSRGR